MRILCPDCGTAPAAGNVNLGTGLARCVPCDGVFQAGSGPRSGPRASAPAREEVGRPPGVQIEQVDGVLLLRRRWFHLRYIGFAFFTAIWNLFLLFWYVGALAGSGGVRWLSLLFPLGHVAAGVWLSYYTLSGFLNRTRVRVSQETIEVSHRPIPWPAPPPLHVTAVEQLYVFEKVQRRQNGKSTSYEVHAMLTGRRSRKLLSGLDRPEEALFIAQQVEKFLQIEDVPMPGEYQAPMTVLRSGERTAGVGSVSLGQGQQDGELSGAQDGELSEEPAS